MENKKKFLNAFFGLGIEDEEEKEQGLENKFEDSEDEVQITTKEEEPVKETKYEEDYNNLLEDEKKEEKEEVFEEVAKEVKNEKITLGRNDLRDMDVSNYQNIVARVKKFEDAKKIAEYIRNDKIVTLNIEELDKETAQRIIDFLSGAMSIKEASFIEISKCVYVSVPKNQKVLFDGLIGKKENIFGGVGI